MLLSIICIETIMFRMLSLSTFFYCVYYIEFYVLLLTFSKQFNNLGIKRHINGCISSLYKIQSATMCFGEVMLMR